MYLQIDKNYQIIDGYTTYRNNNNNYIKFSRFFALVVFYFMEAALKLDLRRQKGAGHFGNFNFFPKSQRGGDQRGLLLFTLLQSETDHFYFPAAVHFLHMFYVDTVDRVHLRTYRDQKRIFFLQQKLLTTPSYIYTVSYTHLTLPTTPYV